MTSTTPFFKPFGSLLFGRRGRSALDSISRLESLEDLYAIFGDLFAERLLERSDKGANSRRRSLPPQVTFWAFVAQALSPKTSCREVVRRVEAWWRWGQLRSASSITDSAYIQARQRLDLATLRLIRGQVAWQLERTVLKEERWLEGREVKIVDGTSFSMPDTAANQAVWPRPGGQQPGRGFPVARWWGFFPFPAGRCWRSAWAISIAMTACSSPRCGIDFPRVTSCSATGAFAPMEPWRLCSGAAWTR